MIVVSHNIPIDQHFHTNLFIIKSYISTKYILKFKHPTCGRSLYFLCMMSWDRSVCVTHSTCVFVCRQSCLHRQLWRRLELSINRTTHYLLLTQPPYLSSLEGPSLYSWSFGDTFEVPSKELPLNEHPKPILLSLF